MTQDQAIDILKLGKNVFLTGAPGAGKTYVLNKYTEFLASHDVHAAITAYTGIAASHVNGRTLHSWAGLSFSPLTLEQERERVHANEFLTERVQRARVLIIDEISMLHPEEFDRVDFICKTARGSLEPFGGLQLICCGDFFQIPPVNQEKDEFVIDCAAWKAANMQVCYLHEQHRQGDKDLLGILEEIREGRVGKESLRLLQSRVRAKIASPIGIARLYTHNENVDEINERELQKLEGDLIVYDAHATGQANLIEKIKKDHRITEKLTLKTGARVMFTRNNPGMGYANGTLGEIIGFHPEENGEPTPVIRTFEGKEVYASREQWVLEEDGNVRAAVYQIPLRLAWAITVHKSQGMTLDAAEIDLSRAFEKGMGYVALSRVKRLENISLLGLNELALEVNDRIKKIDEEFLAQSADTEKYFNALAPDAVARQQEEFLSSSRAVEGEDGAAYGENDIHYEIDEIPAADFFT